jgi:hypothetical protein
MTTKLRRMKKKRKSWRRRDHIVVIWPKDLVAVMPAMPPLEIRALKTTWMRMTKAVLASQRRDHPIQETLGELLAGRRLQRDADRWAGLRRKWHRR